MAHITNQNAYYGQLLRTTLNADLETPLIEIVFTNQDNDDREEIYTFFAEYIYTSLKESQLLINNNIQRQTNIHTKIDYIDYYHDFGGVLVSAILR